MTSVRTKHTIECEGFNCNTSGWALRDERGDVVEVIGDFQIPDPESGCEVTCGECGCEVSVPDEADED